MNRKGQNAMGGVLIAFIGVIVALTIFNGSILPTVGETTNTAQFNNVTFNTLTSVGGQSRLIPGKVLQGSLIEVYNGTGKLGNTTCSVTPFVNAACKIDTNNFSTTNNNIDTDGTLHIKYIVANNVNAFNGTVNASYVGEPQNYVEDGASRSMILLIAVFGALAIAITAIAPSVLEMMGF